MEDFMNVQQSLGLLGMVVKDKVTSLTGVVTSIAFDLYGCIQAIVVPEVKEDNTTSDGKWFDVCRLKVISKTPVMAVPDFKFTKKGPAEKPER
jgi:hypothetical protein